MDSRSFIIIIFNIFDRFGPFWALFEMYESHFRRCGSKTTQRVWGVSGEVGETLLPSHCRRHTATHCRHGKTRRLGPPETLSPRETRSVRAPVCVGACVCAWVWVCVCVCVCVEGEVWGTTAADGGGGGRVSRRPRTKKKFLFLEETVWIIDSWRDHVKWTRITRDVTRIFFLGGGQRLAIYTRTENVFRLKTVKIDTFQKWRCPSTAYAWAYPEWGFERFYTLLCTPVWLLGLSSSRIDVTRTWFLGHYPTHSLCRTLYTLCLLYIRLAASQTWEISSCG